MKIILSDVKDIEEDYVKGQVDRITRNVEKVWTEERCETWPVPLSHCSQNKVPFHFIQTIASELEPGQRMLYLTAGCNALLAYRRMDHPHIVEFRWNPND